MEFKGNKILCLSFWLCFRRKLIAGKRGFLFGEPLPLWDGELAGYSSFEQRKFNDMKAATERKIIRWLHIIASVPIIGYIYGPVKKFPHAVFAIKWYCCH